MAEDVKIKCSDCGENFIFYANEIKWYEEKGFVPPKRCRACRNKRKDYINRKNNKNLKF